MNEAIRPIAAQAELLPPAAEVLHLKRLLQTRELAWLRVLKEAQAKEQCRQL